MKRALIIFLFLISSQIAGDCVSASLPPLQPLNQPNANQQQDYTGNDTSANSAQDVANNGNNPDSITSLPDPFVSRPTDTNLPNNTANLNTIEQTIFGKSFTNQSLKTRLSRIEKSLFSATYNNISDKQRIDNIVSSFNQVDNKNMSQNMAQNMSPNISTNEISRLESKVFNQNFAQANPQARIGRLEQQIFGAEQSGDLNSRLNALKIVIKNYHPNKVANDFDDFTGTTSARNGWGGFSRFGGLSNSFRTGSMTGFTPPITPYNCAGNSNPYSSYSTNNCNSNYNSYSNPYRGVNGMNQGAQSRNGIVGSFYHDSFENVGTGCGVHILD